MRLKEMRERVKSLLGYKPEAQAFADDVDRALNDALAEVWTSRAWTFTERETAVDVLPDITPDTVGSGITVTVKNAQRIVTFSAEVPDLRADVDRQALPGRSWVGQFFHYADRDYRIQEVTFSGSSTVLILEEPIRLETSVEQLTGVTDWRLKWVYLGLPEDCGEILGLTDADFPHASATPRDIEGLPARRAEEFGLQRDQTGNATCWIADAPLIVPPAGRTSVAVGTSGAAASNSHGFIVQRYYQVTWAFSKGGRIGPLAEPSAAFQVTPAGSVSSQFTVTCLGEDGLTAASTDAPDYTHRERPLPMEGLKKVLFWNSNINPTTGEARGVPCWREITRRSGLSTEAQADWWPFEIIDTANTGTINQPHQVHPHTRRVPVDPEGVHPRVRLHPRPSEYQAAYPEYEYGATSADAVARKLIFKQSMLRYVARPPIIAEQGETPPMPSEFHQVLVHRAAATMMRTLGDVTMAEKYERLVSKDLARFEKRHGSRRAVSLRKGMAYGAGPVSGRPSFSNSIDYSRS